MKYGFLAALFTLTPPLARAHNTRWNFIPGPCLPAGPAPCVAGGQERFAMVVRRLRWLPLILVMLVVSTAAARPQQDEDQKKQEFLRFVDDANGGGKLQTAIVTYRNAGGVTVHLVAAVHIADQSYYDQLNKTFKSYDAVLYEMVKPKDMAPPQPGEERSTSMISVIQRFMKDTLDLKFQLDAIDYQAPNFVHADLDAEAFQKMEEERGESIWTLMLQQMLKQMMNPPANQPDIGVGDLLNALTSPDRARQLKLLLGRQFGDIEAQMSGFAGTVLITERNKACFKVLDREIKDGKRNLAIFFGAGHMDDMQKRLLSRGFHETDSKWLTAWNMTEGADHAKKHDTEEDDVKPGPKSKHKQQTDDDPAGSNGVIKIEYIR